MTGGRVGTRGVGGESVHWPAFVREGGGDLTACSPTHSCPLPPCSSSLSQSSPSPPSLLPQTVTAETCQPWHAQPCFGPFAFYDVAGMESSPSGSASVQNKAEAHMVLCIYRELVHR